MNDQLERLKAHIRGAFASAPPPAPTAIRGSHEGDEPFLLEADFRGVPDWRELTASFIDRAPDGFGTALSFFSREAFRYYLPAYLVADLDDALKQADPLFHLWHGLDDETRERLVNERRFGRLTWFEAIAQRFQLFTEREAGAVVAYLRFKQAQDDFARPQIEQALRNFWLTRLGSGEAGPGSEEDAGQNLTVIRIEEPEDAPSVRTVIERAFGRTSEADLVEKLRRAGGHALCLVAVEGATVAGHILFTPVVVAVAERRVIGMGLAPLAVLPERQRQGLGSQLVRRGIEILAERNCPFVVVLGHPEYYPRFGFAPASRHGLSCPWDGVRDAAFMALVLDERAMAGVFGVARYREEFEWGAN